MNCGFLDKDYSVEYKDLSEEEIERICTGEEYFSINANNEYYIFIANSIYKVENTDKVMPLLVKINKELLMKK